MLLFVAGKGEVSFIPGEGIFFGLIDFRRGRPERVGNFFVRLLSFAVIP